VAVKLKNALVEAVVRTVLTIVLTLALKRLARRLQRSLSVRGRRAQRASGTGRDMTPLMGSSSGQRTAQHSVMPAGLGCSNPWMSKVRDALA
jgi:hypothetical protein